MRLTRFEIARYGNFDSVRLDLDPRPGRLNLVVAPNGAGKSVVRRAFGDLLFGIDMQSKMDFGFGYEGMRLSATVATPTGEVAFTRRKGKLRTLLDAAGAPVDESMLRNWLGNADRDLLERLFTLDTAQLRRAETELKATHGAFASALLAGTGELRPAQQVLRALRERRDAVWAPRKSSLPLNKAIRAWEDARRALRDSVLAPPHRAAQERRLQDHAVARDEANARYEAARAAHARLSRTIAVRPLLDQHDRAAEWLLANADAPVLPHDLGDRLAAARGALALAGAALEAARMAQAQAAARAGDIVVDEAALAAAPAIAQLDDRRGANEKAADDLIERRREVRETQTVIARLLEDLGLDIPAARAAEFLPKPPAVDAARDRIRDYAARSAALEAASGALRDSNGTLQELTAASDAPDAASLPPGLADLLAEIRADGDPARRSQDAAAAVQAAEAVLAAGLAMVPGWTRDAAALRAMTPSNVGAYERLDTARQDAEGEARVCAAEHRRQAAALAGQVSALSALGAGRPLQDPAALPAARRRRDAGWQLVHRKAFTSDQPSEAELRAYAGDVAMPLAFERAIEAADRLADEREADAARLSQALRTTHEIASAEAPLQLAADESHAASARAAVAQSAWAADCAPLGLPADSSIGDVREFLSCRAAVVDALWKHDAARAAQGELAKVHAGWASQLAELTNAPGRLPALLAHADALVAAAQAAERARDTLQGQLRSAQAAARKAERNAESAEAAMAEWRQAWTHALAALGRPAGEPPEVTGRLLTAMGELRQASREMTSFEERIEAMQAGIAAFEADAARVHAILHLDPPGDSFEASRALSRRAGDAGLQASKRDGAARAASAAHDAVRQGDTERERSRDALAALIAEAGADSAEAAERRIGLAQERRLHEAARLAAETGLMGAGGSLPLAVLRSEAASADLAQTPGLLESAEAAMHDAKAQATDAAVILSQVQAEIDRDSAATDARDAAAALAAAEATLRRTLDDALLLQLAAAQMDAAMKRVEDGAGDANLARLGAAFRRLTDGAYAGLAVGEEKDVTVLHAMEAGTGRRRTVEQLSEGSRDQLYLALRLVAIADHAANAPPLPFLGDDILQTFDDGRARATFQALLDLSHSVQVVVLTHHPHLAALAAGLPVHVQEIAPALVASAAM